MKALVLGCSHAAGSEMWCDPKLSFPSGPAGFYKFDHGVTRSFPVKIAQALGFDQIENFSIPGGSNDAMLRIFLDNKLDSTDLVISCWTGVNRTEIYDNEWIHIAPGKEEVQNQHKEFYRQWVSYSSDQAGRLNKIKNIVTLNALAAQQSIRVINIDSFWPVSNFEPYGYWPVQRPFFDWAVQQGFAKTDGGHFFEDAHQAFADYVLQNLKIQLDI